MIGKLIILCILLQLHCTNSQNTSPLLTTCNNCCQGQTGREGNPGIPGVLGINGNPGIVGSKGDKGESMKGETGDVGAHGQKGDSGNFGLKGDQGLEGLRGPDGPAGITGLPGVKGQKVEIGQSQVANVSAFSAVRRSSFTPSSDYVPLPFQQFHTNVGDDFDLASGRFTCEIPGIYMFTYSLLTDNSNLWVNLMKDNTLINSVHNNDNSAPHVMLSNAAVLQLNAGEQVWLRCAQSGSLIYSDSWLYTSFSGVLLHEL